jgi:hypothetical protein
VVQNSSIMCYGWGIKCGQEKANSGLRVRINVSECVSYRRGEYVAGGEPVAHSERMVQEW